MEAPFFRALMLASRIGDFCKFPQDCVQEPAQPDALSLAVLADAVHSVIPIPRAHEGKTMNADFQAASERARAVLEQRRARSRYHRLEVRFGLPGGERVTLEEGN